MGRQHQPYEQHHAVEAKGSAVSVSQMLAAGLASVGAAVVTSRFGVAGTVIGAALTTMIITGGSAIIKSYLETLGGRVKSAPEKLRASRMRQQSGRAPEGPSDEPTRAVETGEGRRGIMDRLRSSFGWFRQLPSSGKRSILLKAAIPAVLVFVLAIVAVTGLEFAGGRTLSCMVWGECYVAADGSGPSSSLGLLASGGSGSDGGPLQRQPGDSGGGLFDSPAEEQYE
ncbi:MAG: hypothetical protein ACRDSJ_04500 [Rubrobacteraceae bacterium]